MRTQLGTALLAALTMGFVEDTSAFAQTPDTTVQPAGETDPAKDALQKEKEIAKLREEIAVANKNAAEAEKAKLAAELPTTSTTGSDGSVSIKEGSGYFAELLAFQSLAEAAAETAAAVCEQTKGKTVIITTGTDLADDAQLWAILDLKLDDFAARFEALDKAYPADFQFGLEALGTTLATANALLGAAGDIAAFFKATTEISGRTVDLPESALAALVAQRLAGTVIDPSRGLAESEISKEVRAVSKKRHDLADRKRELSEKARPDIERLTAARHEVTRLTTKISDLEAKENPDGAAIQAAQDEWRNQQNIVVSTSSVETLLNQLKAEIDTTLAAFDAFVGVLTTRVEGKPSPLEAVRRADAAKARGSALILHLDIDSQGGEIHVRRSPWSTRIVYVGGAVVSYVLTDQSGKVTSSGSVGVPRAKSVRAKNAGSELTLGAPASPSKPSDLEDSCNKEEDSDKT